MPKIPPFSGDNHALEDTDMERTTTVISQADVERQLAICDKVAQLTAQFEEQPLAFVDTYGCQQNEADSERIRGYLLRESRITAYVINTPTPESRLKGD